MKLKERVENNIVVFLLGALLTGFLAGIGVYKGILEIAKLDVVQEGNYIGKDEVLTDYVLREEFESLNARYQQILNENRRLNQAIVAERATPTVQIDKQVILQTLEQLIDEGQSFLNDEGQNQSFSYEEWKNRSIQILDLVDILLKISRYKDQFDEITDHPSSQVFLDVPSVRKGLVILRTIKDILEV